MSAISSVSSTPYPYDAPNRTGFDQIAQDFNSIGSALQSGDVSAAQTALSSFQQDLPGNSQTSDDQPFGDHTQANTDYQSLVSSLQSGNLSSAQKAFASLQTDLQNAQTSTRKGRGGHHHHRSGGAAAALINNLAANSTTPSSSATNANSAPPTTGSTNSLSLTISITIDATFSMADSLNAAEVPGLNVTA